MRNVRQTLTAAISSYFKEVFAVDLRALAAFRVALALLLLIDLGTRLESIEAHYTDFGVLPLEIARARFPLTSLFSLHMLSGEAWLPYLLHMLAAAAAAALLVGFAAKTATVVSYILLASLHARNEVILYGADYYLTAFLFWSMFLPLGARFSVDKFLSKKTADERNKLCTPAAAALTLQIVLVYLFSAVLKTGPEWRDEGSALYYALHIDRLTSDLGAYLLNMPETLTWLSLGVFYLEAFGPLLLFSPLNFVRFRIAGVLVFALMHLGIVLFLNLYLIPWCSLAGLLVLLPGVVWDRTEGLALRVFRVKSRSESKHFTEQEGTSSAQKKLLNFLVCLLIVLMLHDNFRSAAENRKLQPHLIHKLTRILRIEQDWSFYAPFPYKVDAWYSMIGVLSDGTKINLWEANKEAQPPSLNSAKPDNLNTVFRNGHWDAYLYFLWSGRHGALELYFAKYLCRSWTGEGAPELLLERVEIYYTAERTLPLPMGEIRSKPRNLIKYDCNRST